MDPLWPIHGVATIELLFSKNNIKFKVLGFYFLFQKNIAEILGVRFMSIFDKLRSANLRQIAERQMETCLHSATDVQKLL